MRTTRGRLDVGAGRPPIANGVRADAGTTERALDSRIRSARLAGRTREPFRSVEDDSTRSGVRFRRRLRAGRRSGDGDGRSSSGSRRSVRRAVYDRREATGRIRRGRVSFTRHCGAHLALFSLIRTGIQQINVTAVHDGEFETGDGSCGVGWYSPATRYPI